MGPSDSGFRKRAEGFTRVPRRWFLRRRRGVLSLLRMGSSYASCSRHRRCCGHQDVGPSENSSALRSCRERREYACQDQREDDPRRHSASRPATGVAHFILSTVCWSLSVVRWWILRIGGGGRLILNPCQRLAEKREQNPFVCAIEKECSGEWLSVAKPGPGTNGDRGCRWTGGQVDRWAKGAVGDKDKEKARERESEKERWRRWKRKAQKNKMKKNE